MIDAVNHHGGVSGGVQGSFNILTKKKKGSFNINGVIGLGPNLTNIFP